MRDPVRRNKTPKGGRAALSSSRANSGLVTANVCIFLVGIVWIVFGQTLQYEFVNYDDDQYVRANSRITNGLTLDGIRWAFTHVHAANWHPLTTISHMLDCQLYGLQPWGHHLTNVLLHAVATVFLFLALWQLTGARWSSAFVAAVFAIHPLAAPIATQISRSLALCLFRHLKSSGHSPESTLGQTGIEACRVQTELRPNSAR